MIEMNFKLKELIVEMYQAVKTKFPEIEFIRHSRSPDDPENIWIHVVPPDDIDRKIEMNEFAADKGHEILEEYGYWISIMPNRRDTFNPIRQNQMLDFENSLRELDSHQAGTAMSAA